jgi:hypothetical protein
MLLESLQNLVQTPTELSNYYVASHCSIAMMAACNEALIGVPSSTKSLNHLAQAIKLIQARLQTDEALSDSTIRAVLSLLILGQLRQQHANARIHFEGLQRMIELRGGLTRLQGNRPLLLKICKYALPWTFPTGVL